MALTANASPTKRFFIENLTRDLSLEDAILDLIDNSVDGYIRTKGIEVAASLLRAVDNPPPQQGGGAVIEIDFTEDEFVIKDRCGGIGLDRARDYAFRFGNAEATSTGSLGVYGIGMKRALFKLGRNITVVSKTELDGFKVNIDTKKWAELDDDWSFPMQKIPQAPSTEQAGTVITVRKLNPEVQLRLRDPKLIPALVTSIAKTYALFLTRFLTVSLNGKLIQARPLPIGESSALSPAHKQVRFDGVTVDLIAALAPRGKDVEWASDQAGWYVLCNGRVVVSADKTDLTGWGTHMPQFVPKYRGFVGIAFFFSERPGDLPWTTTKRGLNRESEVFQLARHQMTGLAKPVLSFLNNMYPSEPAESLDDRRLADELQGTDVRSVVQRPPAVFKPPARRSGGRSTVSVQFTADKSAIDRVRRCLGKPSNWPAGNVGRHALEYFLEMECSE